MVASEITVVSKRAGVDEGAVKWQSKADGRFTVEEAERASHGTDVILTLREDDKKYLEEWEIRQLVKKYSDYIEHPVTMDVTREKPEPDAGEVDSKFRGRGRRR